jgi:DNA-binding NarL/FixJ family response regulator
MRGDDRFKALPVVFLTAKGMTTDRIQGFNAGCDAYLPKPFDPDELVAVVTNLLKRRAATVDVVRGGGGGSGSSGDNPEIADLARQIEELRRAVLGQRSGNGIVQKTSLIQIDLTPREKSVLDLVAQGLMNKEIAKQLETSVRNVEKYVSRLFSKTGTNSRTELVRFALEHGLTT